ncbi:MAG: SprB repeat-containing protein, partial [Cyclobacteriaceae bacterium]|nr:SprB repeat-containing protein [Cyclobacteriaceae bacterium]
MKNIFIKTLLVISAIVFGTNAYSQLSVNASVTTNASCVNFGDGEVTLNIPSGTAPYTIEFYLFQGSDIPIVTINNTSETTILINDNISVATGTVAYEPGWQAFGIKANESADVVAAIGTGSEYRVRVTSSNTPPFNVRVVSGLIVTEPAKITLDTQILVDNTTCVVGSTNGSISFTHTGGVGPFSYSWTGPGTFTSTSQNISGLAGGSYSVTVTDDFTVGCSEVLGPFVLADPTPNTYNITTLTPVICNNSDLDIVLDGSDLAIGGEPDVIYTIFQNGIATTVTKIGTGASPFTITVLDGDFAVNDGDAITVRATQGDCTEAIMVGTANVTVNNLPNSALVVSDPSTCNPAAGDLNITVSGAETGVTYEVTVLGTPLAPPVTGLGAGADLNLIIPQVQVPTVATTYDIEATIAGCTLVTLADQAVVTVNPTPVIDPLGDQTVCDSYTLPVITGTNLTGGEAYYDAPSGGGTQYLSGASLTTGGTYYLYDATGTTP